MKPIQGQEVNKLLDVVASIVFSDTSEGRPVSMVVSVAGVATEGKYYTKTVYCRQTEATDREFALANGAASLSLQGEVKQQLAAHAPRPKPQGSFEFDEPLPRQSDEVTPDPPPPQRRDTAGDHD